MGKPKYFDKHPCTGCTTGYGECAQGAAWGMKCCNDCAHPTRWLPNPYTDEDRAEMEEVRKSNVRR